MKSEFFRLAVQDHNQSKNIEEDISLDHDRTHFVNGSDYEHDSAMPVLSESILNQLYEEERERKTEQ